MTDQALIARTESRIALQHTACQTLILSEPFGIRSRVIVGAGTQCSQPEIQVTVQLDVVKPGDLGR